MANKDAVGAMADFAKKEFADENVRFWMAVQELKTLTEPDAIAAAAAATIDAFLTADAPTLVNLPGRMLARFAQPSASGEYAYGAEMFDAELAEIRKLIHDDTFARFKLSDEAEALLWDVPMLAVEAGMFKAAFSSEKAQQKIKPLVIEARELTGADRVTAWLVDGEMMWSIASTRLGNAVIEIPVGAGLAGQSAESGADLLIEDAYKDERFNQAVDKVTGYHTRSVLCVPLKRQKRARRSSRKSAAEGPGSTQLVLQLLNKIGHDMKHTAFTPEDVTTLRAALEQRFVDVCDSIALTANKGIRKSFADYLLEDGSEEALRARRAEEPRMEGIREDS
jgi:hypothetical protein